LEMIDDDPLTDVILGFILNWIIIRELMISGGL
jgi:hypothetical protein